MAHNRPYANVFKWIPPVSWGEELDRMFRVADVAFSKLKRRMDPCVFMAEERTFLAGGLLRTYHDGIWFCRCEVGTSGSQ